MEIKKKCENCFFKDFYGDEESWTCKHCKFNGIDNDYDTNCKHDYFKPNEKAIREDERNKVVDILGMDLEEAKKVLVETLKSTDKEQLYKDLVSSGLLVEKEQ